MPARPDRLGRLPRTLYIFDNLPKLSDFHIEATLVPTSPPDMRCSCREQTLVTLSARDHRFGTRHNWPVGSGRKPTSRAASKRVAAVQAVFVICRAGSRGKRWMAYLRTSWTRGFLPLQTYRGRSDRAFRSLDRLVSFLREDFRYEGEISLFMPGDPGLQRFRILLPTDRAALDGAGRRPPADGLNTRKPRTD